MHKLGVATATEVDIETLESRLREEIVKQQGTAMGIGFISAWARKTDFERAAHIAVWVVERGLTQR